MFICINDEHKQTMASIQSSWASVAKTQHINPPSITTTRPRKTPSEIFEVVERLYTNDPYRKHKGTVGIVSFSQDGIDYGWDEIEDIDVVADIQTEPRFLAYMRNLLDLSSDMEQLHKLFVANRDVFVHNQEQLRQKPYDIISLEQLAHK